MNTDISKAVNILRKGGIIIFPTDTAFGIGCRIDKKQSIRKLFKIRKRPINQAMPILINGLEMAKEYASISSEVIEKLINPYWPGALTIIMPCNKNKVDKLITGGTNTVGIRMPNEKKVLEVITALGVPITGSSANFHGESTPFSIADLNPRLVELADFVLDGFCTADSASTVIDTTIRPWKVLRKGLIDIKIS